MPEGPCPCCGTPIHETGAYAFEMWICGTSPDLNGTLQQSHRCRAKQLETLVGRLLFAGSGLYGYAAAFNLSLHKPSTFRSGEQNTWDEVSKEVFRVCPTVKVKPSVMKCRKCGRTTDDVPRQKYCGDGSDKDNDHRWEKVSN